MCPALLFFVCLISLQTFHCLDGAELGTTTRDTSWEEKTTTSFLHSSLKNEAMLTTHYENVSKRHEKGESTDLLDQELDEQYYDDDNEPESKFDADKVGMLPKSVYLFFIYFISIFGALGNIFVLILMQFRSIKSSSYSVYLRFLAVTDSLYLISTATEDILDHQFKMLMTTIYHSGEFVCKAWTYVLTFTPLISPWLIVALALDRYAAIIFPFRLKQFTTARTALVLCLLLVLVAGLESLVFVIPTKYYPEEVDGEFCDIDPSQTLETYNNVRMLCLQSTLPSALILYFNVHVICAIKKSSKFRKSANAGENRKGSNRTTLSLVTISLMAFCTLTPIAVLQVLEALWIRDIENLLEKPVNETDIGELAQLEDNLKTVDDIWPLLNLIRLLNFGQNFYVMILTGPKYRQIFTAIMCRCCLRSKADKQFRTTSHDRTRTTELATRISSASN